MKGKLTESPRQAQRDARQRRLLPLPRGDVTIGAVPGHPARVLRRILGYDARRFAPNAITVAGVAASAGWQHAPSGLLVTASRDASRWGPLLHVALSYADHDPTWAEIKAVKQVFFPADTDAAMILPRDDNYVNLHTHCYHLTQLPQEWDIG